MASHHCPQDTCETCVSSSHNFKCCWSISFRSQGRNAVAKSATDSVEEVQTATWSLLTYVTSAIGQVGDCYYCW